VTAECLGRWVWKPWWNDADMGNWITLRETCVIHLFPPQISLGLSQDQMRPAGWSMARPAKAKFNPNYIPSPTDNSIDIRRLVFKRSSW
jgi:hypothetical protein